MERRIKVEYFRDRCIGNGNCVKASKEFEFRQEENKASLRGAVASEGRMVLSKSFTDQEPIIAAARGCPVNAIRLTDADTNEEIVGIAIKHKDAQQITAAYDDAAEFVMDPKGYFLIRINREKKEIEVGYCPALNKVALTIRGHTPLEIYQTIIKRGLLSRMDHAAYLGRELQKAYIALTMGVPYVQDDELSLR
ncbi:DUF4346 domain-containing protein [Candidatus Woesearchaeota archaeon]|nr:DUF4346 domain-containing protein [Candidatus Woesearchaeota archaeon]